MPAFDVVDRAGRVGDVPQQHAGDERDHVRHEAEHRGDLEHAPRIDVPDDAGDPANAWPPAGHPGHRRHRRRSQGRGRAGRVDGTGDRPGRRLRRERRAAGRSPGGAATRIARPTGHDDAADRARRRADGNAGRGRWRRGPLTRRRHPVPAAVEVAAAAAGSRRSTGRRRGTDTGGGRPAGATGRAGSTATQAVTRPAGTRRASRPACGPVSSGSPLTSGAHSLSGTFALGVATARPCCVGASDSPSAPRRRRPGSTALGRLDEARQLDGRIDRRLVVVARWAGRTEGRVRPARRRSPAARSSRCGPAAGPLSRRLAPSGTAGTAPIALSGDASRASSSRCFRATTSSVGKRSARFGAGPRGVTAPGSTPPRWLAPARRAP